MADYNKAVLCIGGAHIDRKFTPLNRLIEHTSNPVISDMSYGGVIRNVAENLSRLDVDVSLLSVVGNDALGNQLLKDMSSLMNINQIDMLDGFRTGQYYAVLNQSGDMDIAYADMSIYKEMNDKWILSKLAHLHSYAYVIADLNIQETGIHTLVDWALRHKQKLILIGVSEPKMSYLPRSLKGVDLLICNVNEAMAYFKQKVSYDRLFDLWKETGVNQVIMTGGPEDIGYLDSQHQVHYFKINPVAENLVIDTTGAGDAFSSGMIFGLLESKSLHEAMVYGEANAKLTIRCKDTVNQDLTVEHLLMEVSINE